jgi:hypothetical protein
MLKNGEGRANSAVGHLKATYTFENTSPHGFSTTKLPYEYEGHFDRLFVLIPPKEENIKEQRNKFVCDPTDAIELNSLKQELEVLKTNAQELIQTKLSLEEQLSAVMKDFENFKKLHSQQKPNSVEELKHSAAQLPLPETKEVASSMVYNSRDAKNSRKLCKHFLKGRCRQKMSCQFSHEIIVCPYCSTNLPRATIASSTHLSRCYKAHKQLIQSAQLTDAYEVIMEWNAMKNRMDPSPKFSER